MSPREPAPCTHDRGAGTTVCFRCRHEAGIAQRARLRRMASWGALAVMAIAALSAAGKSSGLAIPALGKKARPAAGGGAAVAPVTATEAVIRDHGAQGEQVQQIHLVAASESDTAATPPSNAPAKPQPVLEEGVTTLRGGIEAVRHGDTVVVSFDLPAKRTRRADRFEQLVRATLPAIYGAFADSLLASHRSRLVTDAAVLVNDLPKRGLDIGSPGAWHLIVWPETRPGRDGPLVVRYRATLSR